jgi:hypothetical protein
MTRSRTVLASALLVAGSCREPDATNLSAAGPLLVGTATPASAAATKEQKVPVARVVEGSTSVILKATHIVVVTVSHVDEAEDQVHLDVTLADTLKGIPIAAPGATLRVSGQRAQPGRRELTPQGPWAAVEHNPGSRLVAFSNASPGTTAVLAEPALLRVLSASPAEAEVRRALAVDRDGGPLSARIRTISEPPALSPLFGEYVVARLDEDTLYRDAAGFDKVMTWFEDPGRSTSLQMFMLLSLVGKVLLTEPNPPGFTERLALSALRILASTSDEPLARQIVDTYLPNLLGLEGAGPRKTVQMVIKGDEGTRMRVRAALQRRPAGAARDRVLQWIGP